MHRPVLVVSVGRSGTSTVARLLHEHCGIHMGDVFPPPDKTNPGGFYEDGEFRQINEAIAKHNHLHAMYWEILMRQLLEAKIAQDRPWGFKDPRLCFFLGYYLDNLRALGVEPIVLRPRRPIHKIAASVHMKREGWDNLWNALGTVFIRDHVLTETLTACDVEHYEIWFHRKSREKTPDSVVLRWIIDCLDQSSIEYDRDKAMKSLVEKAAREKEAVKVA